MTTEVERGRQPLEAAWRVIEPLARSLTVGALAGFIAGLIAGGIGSRIAMRISAIAAGDRLQGLKTDFGATVGDITAGGTIELLFFGGAVGVFGGLIYLGLRRWVADAGRWKGLAFGVLLLAMFGSGIIEGDNRDFHVFGPPALNIAMFASFFILFGLLVAPLFDLVERIERALPPPSLRRSGLIPLAGHAFVLFPVFPALIVSLFVAGGAALIILPYVIVAMPIAFMLIARAAGRFERLSDLREQRGAMAAALAVLTLPVVVGVVLDVQAVADIYEANF